MFAGAGAIISAGLMQKGTLKAVENHIRDVEFSGDAMFTKATWEVLGIAPTDPGLIVILLICFPMLAFGCTIKPMHVLRSRFNSAVYILQITAQYTAGIHKPADG